MGHHRTGKYGLAAEKSGKFGLEKERSGKFGLEKERSGKFGLEKERSGKFGLGDPEKSGRSLVGEPSTDGEGGRGPGGYRRHAGFPSHQSHHSKNHGHAREGPSGHHGGGGAAAAGETSHGATGRSLPPIQSSISMPLVTGHSMGKTVGKQGGLSYNHSYVQPTQERSSGYGKPKAGKYGRGPMPLGQQRGHAGKPMPAAGMGMGNPGGTSSRYKSKVSSKYISPYSQKAQRAARQGG